MSQIILNKSPKPTSLNFFFPHQKELANYRLAMQRMADDIIALRRQMSGLEAENSALRSERSLNQDAGRSLLSDADIDVMTKAELADRLGEKIDPVYQLKQNIPNH